MIEEDNAAQRIAGDYDNVIKLDIGCCLNSNIKKPVNFLKEEKKSKNCLIIMTMLLIILEMYL